MKDGLMMALKEIVTNGNCFCCWIVRCDALLTVKKDERGLVKVAKGCVRVPTCNLQRPSVKGKVHTYKFEIV